MEEEFTNSHIVDEIRHAKTEYAKQTFSRAVPVLYDGLKESQRRIIYTMYKYNVFEFRKCAEIIGNTLKIHPHGDMAVYGAIAAMVAPFKNRIPLITGKGNYGSLSGLGPAASRYTEAKLSDFCKDIIAKDEINPEYIPFIRNEDNPDKIEPVFLPVQVPLSLLLDQFGVSEGAQVSVPPYNLADVVDRCLLFINSAYDKNGEKQISNGELIKDLYPDFPTACEIVNKNEIDEYAKGESDKRYVAVKYLPLIELDHENNAVVFKTMPYKLNVGIIKNNLEKVKKELKTKNFGENIMMANIIGIPERMDPKDLTFCEFTFSIKKGVSVEQMQSHIIKSLRIRQSYPIRPIYYDNLSIQQYTIKELISEWYTKRFRTVLQKNNNLCRKAELERCRIEGKLAVYDHTDEVIQIIRNANNIEDAKVKLEDRFGLVRIQSEQIVSINLGALSRTGKPALISQIESLDNKIYNYRQGAIASNIDSHICERLKEIKKNFSKPRHTLVSNNDISEIGKDEKCISMDKSAFGTNGISYYCSNSANFNNQARPFSTLKNAGMGPKVFRSVFSPRLGKNEKINSIFLIGDDYIRKEDIQTDRWVKPSTLSNPIRRIIPASDEICLLAFMENYSKFRKLSPNQQIRSRMLARFEIPFDMVLPCTKHDTSLVIYQNSYLRILDISDTRVMGKHTQGVKSGISIEKGEPLFSTLRYDEYLLLYLKDNETHGSRMYILDCNILKKSNKIDMRNIIDPKKYKIVCMLGIPNPYDKKMEMSLLCHNDGAQGIRNTRFRFFVGSIGPVKMKQPLAILDF